MNKTFIKIVSTTFYLKIAWNQVTHYSGNKAQVTKLHSTMILEYINIIGCKAPALNSRSKPKLTI